MTRLALCGLILALAAACKKDSPTQQTPAVFPGGDTTFKPSGATLLSTSTPGNDEDPFVLKLRNGRMLVAWFSDHDGNPDIYITSTLDGVTWTPQTRITNNAFADYYPSLFEDAAGTVHLTWFRWVNVNLGQVFYSSSPDGLTWSPANEIAATTILGSDEWVPSITQAANGNLLIYFVSAKRRTFSATSDLYVAVKRAGSATWDAAVPVPGVNSATEHDHLPSATRTGDRISLVWTRNDLTAEVPWLAAKSTLYYATSADGLAFTTPVRITNDAGNVLNVFPTQFLDSSGAWQLLFLSTRNGQAIPYSLPLANVASYPAGLVAESSLGSGYSHHVAATTSPGVYLGVWVTGPDGAHDVYYRFFRR